MAGIALTQRISVASLDHYRAAVAGLVATGGAVPPDFVGLTLDEVDAVFVARRDELDALLCLSLLSAVEAMFRMDYLTRAESRRPRNQVTSGLRDLYRRQGVHAHFEDILSVWREVRSDLSEPISDLRSALHYRHWLAHGRYWVPKWGKRYDFVSVYRICEALEDTPFSQ